MPLKQILHAVELSRLPEPSPPAEGEAEAEAEAEEEEVPEVSEELISTPLPYRPLDFERFGALMAHSRYEATGEARFRHLAAFFVQLLLRTRTFASGVGPPGVGPQQPSS